MAQEETVDRPPEEQVSQHLLPDSWSEEVDPASGQTYYYNSVSGETSWGRPLVEGAEEMSGFVEEAAQMQELLLNRHSRRRSQ